MAFYLAAALTAYGAEKTSAPADPPTFTTGRELLKTFAIDDSHWSLLADGKPVTETELPTLLRVLFRAPTLPTAEVDRLAESQFDLATFSKTTSEMRGDLVRLRGRVTSVEARKCSRALADRFEFEDYYRCEVRLDRPAIDVVVYARGVPAAWRKGGKFDQPVGATGVFLKFEASDPAKPRPVFAAARLAWYPDTLLGSLGMDYGLLDDVRNQAAILPEERDAFYGMMAAVGRARPMQLMQTADEELKRAGREAASVVPLFNQADAQRGRLVVLQGSARRVVKILVDEKEIRERFGIDHYYEIDLFTYGTREEPDADSRGNPIVFCVPDVPRGMPVGDDARYGETVRIAGFYFKHWAYRLPGSDAKANSQLAPLLVGQKPIWIVVEKPESSYVGQFIVGGIVVIVSLGIWIYGVRAMRRQRAAPLYRQPGAATMDVGLSLERLSQKDKDQDKNSGETSK